MPRNGINDRFIFEDSPRWFPEWLDQFIIVPTVNQSSPFPSFHSAFVVMLLLLLLIFAILYEWRNLKDILISISLIARNSENFFEMFLIHFITSENSVQIPSPFSFFPLGFCLFRDRVSVFFSPGCFQHLCGIINSWSYVYSCLVLILFYWSTGLFLCLSLRIWNCNSPNIVLCAQDCFGHLWSLFIPYEF